MLDDQHGGDDEDNSQRVKYWKEVHNKKAELSLAHTMTCIAPPVSVRLCGKYVVVLRRLTDAMSSIHTSKLLVLYLPSHGRLGEPLYFATF